eukprot:133852-Pyramimonas_sp.AAC.1
MPCDSLTRSETHAIAPTRPSRASCSHSACVSDSDDHCLVNVTLVRFVASHFPSRVCQKPAVTSKGDCVPWRCR